MLRNIKKIHPWKSLAVSYVSFVSSFLFYALSVRAAQPKSPYAEAVDSFDVRFAVRCMVISPDGATLAISGDSNDIVIYNLLKKQITTTFRAKQKSNPA